jgi:site-specific DNA recombinase
VESLQGKRVGAYARYSSELQNARSVEDQLRVCREHAARLGGRIDNALVFSDAALSGSNTVRPGLQAMLGAVERGEIDVVIVEDLSRIGRDVGDNDRTIKTFQSHGARLLALGGYDSGNEDSFLTGVVLSAVGEQYLRDLRKKTRRGMNALFQAGMSTGGSAYGYRSVSADDGTERRRLEVDPATAPTVRRIFDLFVAGHPQRAIAERLNAEGVKSPRGGKWTHFTTRTILRNEIYAGVVIFGRREWLRDKTTGKRRYVERPKSEWRKRTVPELRIIDAETWAAAQSLVQQTARAFKQGKRSKRGYPLSGLLACGECRSPMVIGGGGKYYGCSGRRTGRGCTNRAALRERDARRWLMDQLAGVVGEPAMLEALRSEWAKSIGDGDRELRSELAKRRAALTATEGQIDRLLEWIADGNATPSTRAKLKEKEDHADLQRAAITALESQLGRVPVLPNVADMRAFLAALPDVLAAEPEEARAFLGELFDGPVLCTSAGGTDAYELAFSYFPDALLNVTSADPVRGRRSFEVVAGAGYQLKRATRAISGVCPRGYAGS